MERGEEPSEADAYLAKALRTLEANKQHPKYEFERGVAAFLGVFLPDIVGWALGESGSIELIAQEFPLKKEESNLSTNVDYVLHSTTPGDRPWVFLELKTDRSSANAEQARIYAEVVVGTTAEHTDGETMEDLLKDVEVLRDANKKYAALVDCFATYRPAEGRIRMMYLTPKDQTARLLLPKSSSDKLVEAFEQILVSVPRSGGNSGWTSGVDFRVEIPVT